MLQAACINCAHPECEGACGGLQVSMTNVDTRQVDRDSLFLLAQLRLAGSEEQYRVKVRNLSAGGMMAEGALTVSRGQLVQVELRNIVWSKAPWRGLRTPVSASPSSTRSTPSAPVRRSLRGATTR